MQAFSSVRPLLLLPTLGRLIRGGLGALAFAVTLLGGLAKADPGDQGTVLGSAWTVVDVIPIGKVDCCRAEILIDVPIGNFSGKALPTPRVRITEPTGLSDTLIFDLQGFGELLQAVEKVESASAVGDYVKAGQAATMLPLDSDGLLRFVAIARLNEGRSKGAFLTYTQDGEQVIGVGWDLIPDEGHSGWPSVLELLRSVEPAVRAYLQRQ